MIALLLLWHGLLAWGIVPWADLSGPLWPGVILASLVVVPGWYWARLAGPTVRSRSEFAALALGAGWAHLLLALWFFSWLGVGLATGAKVLAILAPVPALIWQRRGRAHRPFDAWNPWETAVQITAGVVGMVMAIEPAALQLGSDAPAHLGAIVDALREQRWIVPDHSYPGASGAADPRFGLAHGLYAALADLSGVSPRVVFARLPVVLAPMLFVVRYLLFRALRAPGPLAWGAATLFLFTDGDGRGYSLWSSVYPGHLALGIALLAAAILLSRSRQQPLPRAAVWVAVLALALSGRVHPFGWWITVSWLGVLGLVEARTAGRRALLWHALAAGGLGTILLLPTLLNRSAAPLHSIPTDVLFLHGKWFVIDPLSFARWSSTATFFALVVAIVLCRSLPRAVVVAAGVVIAYSFVPFVTTPAWSAFSYLLVRTGRVFPATLVLLWGSWLAWRMLRERRLVGGILLGLLCAAGVLQEGRALRWLVRGDPPSHAAAVEQELDAVAATGWVAAHGIPLCSPRVAHGLRARVGGEAWAVPVAHASPADVSVRERLDLLRQVYSPRSSYAEFRAALAQTGARALLVVPDVPRFEDFAYITDPGWESTLAVRLDSLGVAVLAAADGQDGPEGWQLYDLSGLPTEGWRAVQPPGERTLPDAVTAFVHPLRTAQFEVVGWSLADSTVDAGGTLTLDLWYRGVEPHGAEVWTQLEIGFDGPQPALPPGLRWVGKPIRKLLLERRGKSLSRWGKTWIPFDGGESWDDDVGDLSSESIRIPVPSYARAGTYRAWLNASDRVWRVQRHLADYLTDRRRGGTWLGGDVEIAPAPPISENF